MRLATLIISLFVLSMSYAQSQKEYKLSTHVLDTYAGIPGEGMKVQLFQEGDNDEWILIDERLSDHDGRVNDFLKNTQEYKGNYKLKFFSREYCQDKYGLKSVFPYIEVVVELDDNSHYHIPITVAPFGYGTYKGR